VLVADSKNRDRFLQCDSDFSRLWPVDQCAGSEKPVRTLEIFPLNSMVADPAFFARMEVRKLPDRGLA
jgi:hypothetical protein